MKNDVPDREMATPEARALDAVVHEAKSAFAPPEKSDAQWAEMEARLLARVARADVEKASAPRSFGAPPSRATFAVASVLAIAAALALFVRKDRARPLGDAGERVEAIAASSLRATVGTGNVKIDGVQAFAGHVLRAGDRIEATGARAVFERAQKVAWLLEHADTEHGIARAHVKAAGESLVLGLEEGAIEAQVAPVASGEAFAVDVASSKGVVRVAVHGTHLRVTRSGSRVSVDLTEGVVTIGTPPRVGSTYGTLVTAPAHVELDADNPEGTLRIDHAPNTVRAAVTLAHADPAPTKEPAAPREGPVSSPSPNVRTQPVSSASPSAMAHVDSPKVPASREAIAAAVRECATARVKPGEVVSVTVTSTLKLKVSESGEVQLAQFDPPLSPDIQACAAAAIYKIRLEGEPAFVTVPIEVTTAR